MQSSIRAIGYTAYRRLTTAIPFMRQTGQMSRIGLITPEIIPAVPLVMGMLYQMGQRETIGQATNSTTEFATVAEGVVTQNIIRHAHDIFPYIPLAVGAYEVGSADGPREKIYQAIRTGIMFTAGYLGVTHLGAGISNALRMLESERLLHALGRDGIHDIIGKSKPELAGLKASLNTLKETALAQRKMIEAITQDKKVSPKAIARASTQFFNAKQAFLELWPKMPLNLLSEKAAAATGNLHRGVVSYQASYIRVLRYLNPTFGYLLATTFIGLPVAALVGKIMKAGYSGRSGEDVNLVKPIWLEPIFHAATNFWPFSMFKR